MRERPRLFGVPPQDTMLVLGFVAALLGIVLAAQGLLLTGIALVAAGIVLLLAFAETFRRRPGSTIVRWLVLAFAVLRADLGFVGTTSTAWLRGQVTRLELRREAASLRRSRRGHLLALGDCVYRGDMEGAETARDTLRSLDERIAGLQNEIAQLDRRTAVRLRAARFWRTRRTAQARTQADAARYLLRVDV
jgi:hypothetical protein